MPICMPPLVTSVPVQSEPQGMAAAAMRLQQRRMTNCRALQARALAPMRLARAGMLRPATQQRRETLRLFDGAQPSCLLPPPAALLLQRPRDDERCCQWKHLT
eukprot:TRINITY_DN15891_c0_g1_i1.p4 TRINITY_DN15891_c0_g1~~TRINITY_DN15891_c0_g1_i1.p4  ORF type:complete len:103 (+),score=13.39 TRINITY_DN15891_c0_g1_i1:1091-1399(+)